MELDVDLDFAGTPVLEVKGDIDFSTVEKLDRRLREVADQGHKQVLVDLSKVGYMDSEGIKVLIRLRNAMGEDSEVTIKGAKGPVMRVLQVSGLPRIFNILE